MHLFLTKSFEKRSIMRCTIIFHGHFLVLYVFYLPVKSPELAGLLRRCIHCPRARWVFLLLVNFICACVCVFQGSCRGTRPDLNLFPLSQELQCPPITLPGARCILGWVPTPRAARRALTGLKDPSMATKVRVICLNGNYFRQPIV